MRCTCEKWIERIKPRQKVHVRSEVITHCPFCGLKLIKDNFKIYLIYDGLEDKDKDNLIKTYLESFNVRRISKTKRLFFELPLP